MAIAGVTAHGLLRLALGIGLLGVAGPVAAQEFLVGQVTEVVSGGTTTPVPPGECRTVDMTAWVTALGEVPLTTTVSLGPDKARLACEFAWERIESQGEERCATNYNDGALYRNGRLLPISFSFSACRCTEGVASTTCTLSTSVQCGHEALQQEKIQVCN